MAPRVEKAKIIAQKRQTLRDELTELFALIENNSSLIELNLRLQEVKILFRDYRELHEELNMINPEDEGLAEMVNIRKDYFKIAAAIAQREREETPSIEATHNLSLANSTMIERQKVLKLPTVTLPSFSGNYHEWLPFIKGFNSKVDNRTDISNGTKFSYLQSCLKGNAAAKISHLIGDDNSYTIAKNLLEETYGKHRVLVFEYVDAIMATEKKRPQTPEELGNVMDELRLNITTLKSLGVNFEPLVAIRYLENVLPPKIREDWDRSLDLENLPTLEQICKFISEAIYRFSNIHREQNYQHKRPHQNNDSRPSKQFRNNKTERSFTTTAEQLKCINCGGNHRLATCDDFLKLNVPQRWELVKNKNLCKNCLNKHKYPCEVKGRCQTCGWFHHTTLHFVKNQNPSDATK